jgi:anti-sigma factor RsiW
VSELRAPRLTCREVVELLSDYLEDGLAPSERARVVAHLQTCPQCMAYLAQLQTTICALGRLRQEDIPAPVRDRLIAVFRAWRSG